MPCIMNSIGANAKTNEEYKVIIKKRITIFTFIIFAGIITAAIAILNEIFFFAGDGHWLNGVYCGVGTGLVFAGIIKIIRFKKLLKDESLLKEDRLKNQDERNQLIASKALQSATIIVLVFSYAAMLIASFYSRIVFYCFWLIVLIFLLSYLVLNKYYNRKL